ncbi:rhomboid family intramembrane serine protease [Effusibacillus lacus]|uniref:Rhomboid family intramembrane serine protease n=1 Tax=Effusibacillus lacus TaxID=1348429 RepID=A0A292YGY8_9BACL|nr:rhomboid family intramembrane serine protease [Effusibacillus lacus]TCS71417.1 membrane associated rhomboid family serine protease [Effusibacillus lacus]GAX89947.1 rhomboid family intramembrane serine protease [Effusibacillus lacus]
MNAFELALARILVRQKGYTWFPPGVLFPELSLFKSSGSRGVLIRVVRGPEVASLQDLLDTSFEEAREILRDHPYRGITVVQLITYPATPNPQQLASLRKLERHEWGPDISVYSAWVGLDKKVMSTNLPWFSRGVLSRKAVLEAANISEDPILLQEMQQDILQTMKQRQAEWQNIYVQNSSKAVFSMLAIIVGTFFWMSVSGEEQFYDTLIRFGAKENSRILEGEYWRLVSPMFLHLNMLHLLVNSFALYSLRDSEWIYGSNRFLLIFLVSGLSGNIASFALSPYPAVGASGAIFGILGSLLYFGTQYRDLFRRTMGSAVWTTLFINLLLGFIIPQISNSGHIGGLIGGFLASAAIGLPKRGFRYHQPLAAIVLGALLAGGLWLGFTFP